MLKSTPARILAAALLLGGLAAPAFANGGMLRSYKPIGAVAAPQASPAPQSRIAPQQRVSNTGRDRVSLDRIRAGAQVGDSLIRLAPTTNNGHFTQFENYQGYIASTTTVNGDNYGTVVTNQNGNILGLVGNNGVLDSSAMVGVDTQGK